MHDATGVWDVSCAGCGTLVGYIADARFVHDVDCALPLRIDRGVLRCCRCGGELSGRRQVSMERPVLAASFRAKRS